MDKFKSAKLKTLLTAILTLVLAVTMVFAAACSANSSSNDSSSSSSSSDSSSETTERTDYQTVSNGDFEYKHDNVTSFPVTSSFGWTRAYDSITTSAVTSLKSSGVISVTEGDSYQTFAKNNDFPLNEDGTTYFNPSTPEKQGLITSDELYVYDEDNKNDGKLATSGDHVLMIHNTTDDGAGTAQKFTSSSTVTVDGYGKLTVWILTKNLNSKMEGVEYGAYVSITNSLGSTRSPLVVKNINTDGKWQKFDFYIAASDYATSTIKVVLGLGFGSKEYKAEYVEGFAFFDNVNYQTVSESDYNAAISEMAANEIFTAYGESKSIETYRYNKSDDDFDPLTVPVKDYTKSEDLKVSQSALTETNKGSGEKTYAAYSVALSHKMPTIEKSVAENATGVTNSDLFKTSATYEMQTKLGVSLFNGISSEKISEIVNPLGNAETVYLIHENGASSKITIAGDDFMVLNGTAAYITFLMKVKTGTAQDGVTVKIIDKGSLKTECETATAVITNVTTNDADDDLLNGWVRVNLFVTNFLGDKFERKFAIEIDFGTTELVEKQIKLTEGYALITGIGATALTEDEYNVASKSGSYSGFVALGAELNNASLDEENNDEYAINYAKSGEGDIVNSVVTSIIGFKGTVGNGKAVGGTSEDYSNENTIAGVINTKYLGNYEELADVKTDIEKLSADEDNDYVQPIVIYNNEIGSYGFIADSKTFSANTVTLVSVKLRVFGSAKAFVYLASTEPLDNFAVLDIEGKAVNRDGNKPVYSTTKETAEVYQKLYQTVTAADCDDDDWITVKFLVKAGENDIPYRVEIFNGSRDGQEQNAGLIAIDSVEYESGVDIDSFKSETVAEYGVSEDDKTYSYKGVVKTVTYTDSDGFSAVKYTNDPSAVDVYTYLANAKTLVVTYENIDVSTDIDETTPVNTDDSSSETEEEQEKAENYSLPLQITSIIISVALIIALLILVFRALFKKMKTNGDEIKTLYNRNSREIAQDNINANKAKREAAAIKKANEGAQQAPAQSVTEEAEPETEESAEEPIEESTEEITEEPSEKKPYDYDNPENNVPENTED